MEAQLHNPVLHILFIERDQAHRAIGNPHNAYKQQHKAHDQRLNHDKHSRTFKALRYAFDVWERRNQRVQAPRVCAEDAGGAVMADSSTSTLLPFASMCRGSNIHVHCADSPMEYVVQYISQTMFLAM